MFRKTLSLTVLGLALMLAQAARADSMKVDPAHSFLLFQIKHMDVSYVWGRIAVASGTVALDDANPSIEITAQADSVDTGVEGRDKHLKGPDFFDAKQYPELSFKSTAVKKTGDTTYEVSGDLTIHGVTRPISVTITKIGEGDKGPPMGYRAGFGTEFSIKRSDFGMNTMQGPVGDDVKIYVNLEASK